MGIGILGGCFVHHRFTITVNGKRRRKVLLTAAEPIPNLEYLALDCTEWPAPQFLAGRDDYRCGAYRFALSHHGRPGTFRVQAVRIKYTDGTSATSPLQDTIVIEIAEIPKRPEHLPMFTAR
jgi:hypothetical protein